MARRSLQDARVLVTGASSGIGRELARQLSAAGARLLLTARRAPRLETTLEELQAAGGDCDQLAGDITDADHRRRLIDRCRQRWQGLDVLAHCAGVGGIGRFDEADEGRLRTLMEVNFFAPVELTRAALPLLSNGRQPAIAVVGSVLALASVPLKSEYCASKAALRGWCDSLAVELREQQIDVIQAHPSTTRSEFFDNVLGDSSAQRSLGAMSAEEAARHVLRAIQRGKPETVFPLAGKALAGLRKWCPPLYHHLLARDLNK